MKKNILNLLLILTMISIVIPSTIYAADLSRDATKKTVSDISTNLMWQDDAILRKAMSDAIIYCEALTLGGYDNWRLPNRFELISLLDYSKKDPAIKESVFQFTESYEYWSSTSQADDTGDAWYVDFDTGDTYNRSKTDNHSVRCVRDET